MEEPLWKTRALDILDMYRQAKQTLSGEMHRSEHMSVVQFTSQKAKTVSDPTGSKVVQLEKLLTFVRRVDAVMDSWDAEDREIIWCKYLSGNEKSDKEVLHSLKRDGFCISTERYRNAKNGALANLAGMMKNVA